MLNTLQLSTHESEIKLDPSVLVSSNYTAAVIEELKQSKPDWKAIRQIISDSGVNDFEEFKGIKPDRIVFTGDLLHSKNQLTPEVVEIASWVLTECSKIAKIVLIPGNHDANLKNDPELHFYLLSKENQVENLS